MINLYSLKYFYDACRLSSMTKAAEANFVSRPAVSQAILRLEKEIGAKLLEHKRRRFQLTKHGRILMERANGIFSQLEEVDSLVRSETQALSGVLVVGAARSLVTYHLDSALHKLKIAHPDLRIKVKIENSETLVRLLATKNIDVAVFLGDERLNGCEQVVLRKGYFNLISSPSSKAVSFAITEKRPETEKLKSLYERKFKKQLPTFCEVSSWDAIQTWINNSTCGGLVPDFISEVGVRKSRVVIPRVWPYEIKAMFHSSRSKDRSVQEFINYVAATLSTGSRRS
jgi:DNA-binding transcriptional LysR family regulator